MAMNEDDFNKIQRRPNQKISIRDDLDVIKTGNVSNSANGLNTRKREAKVSISDGRPTPATPICCEDSNFSVKEEEIQDEKINTDDEASSVMMQVEDVQTEPLDLSCKKNKLKNMQSSTQKSTSVEWYLNKPSSLASSTSTRPAQTRAIPGPYKLSFQYEFLSRPAPYHKPVPWAMAACFKGLGLVHGYFVPGQPSKVTQVENGMEIRLRHPRKWKEKNHQLPQSTCTNTSSCIDPEESQPLSLSEPDSSQALKQSSLTCDCQTITSLNPQLSACDIGQPIIMFPGTNQPFIASSCNGYSSITSASVEGQHYSRSTPDRGQPNMSNMGITLSNCTESISTPSSQEKSSFFNTDEESRMDKGVLPKLRYILSNVKDWEQPNSKHEQVKKCLKKILTSRSKAPD